MQSFTNLLKSFIVFTDRKKILMDHRYQSIEGWFDWPSLYKKMITKYDHAKFAEVGVWKGKSLCFLAVEILKQNKKITIEAIDNFPYLKYVYPSNKDAPQELRKNIENLDCINYVNKDSLEASQLYPDEHFDFVFLDSTHSQEFVEKEIKAWFPKIKIDGYLGGHDYVSLDELDYNLAVGVGRAVTKIFKHRIKLYAGEEDNKGRIYGPSWLHKKTSRQL